MFSVRLVLADHYMSPPIPELDVVYSEFRGAEVKQVPIIRVFGSTVTGKKTCLHIHGVFPYIYVPYEGSEPCDRLMYQITSSLDKALNISLGKGNSAAQHVYKVVLVSGLPFYGFHTKEHQYFKIYFYNPLMVKKATELLQSGAILNKIYQPHEAHVPYILQFMIDYNLYGMNLVNLDNVKFRRDPENPGSFENLSEEILLPERVTRMSTCEIEVDAVAADIINKRTAADELVVNPGLAAIWEDEKRRRREEGRTSQITPQCSQKRPFAASTGSELFFKQKLHDKLLLLNSELSDNSLSLPNTPDSKRIPYPAETPEDSKLIEASFLNVHVQPSGSVSFVGSERVEHDNNISVVDEDLVLSLTSSQRGINHDSVLFDSQDAELAMILQNLESGANVDEDSILGSQAFQELETETVDGSEDEDMQDLRQPLDAAVDSSPNGGFEKEGSSRFTDHQDDSLWENTFWEDVNKIPQLDGADDVPDKSRRRRFGMRGRSFPRRSVHKRLVKSSISEVGRNGSSVWTADSENKLCNGASELGTNELCLSAAPEKASTCFHVNPADDFTEVADDNRNPMMAGGVGREHENDVRNCFLDISNDTDGSATVEKTVTLETVPVTTDDSVTDTKSSHIPRCTRDVKTDVVVGSFELDNLLICAKNDNGPVGVGNLKSMSDDCPSPTNGLIKHSSEKSVVGTEYKISLNGFAEVTGDSVDPVISEVTGSESLIILSEDTVEISDIITNPSTVESVLVGGETNLSTLNSLSQVSGDDDIQGMRNVGSESAKLPTKQVCNESSNSEVNFQPVSVVCCNMHACSCMSDGSVLALQLNDPGSTFEVDGQECDRFRQGVLIGDPSFTAQLSFSEGDNDLQMNGLFSGTSIPNVLSSEQCSETSKSSYITDIDTDLLAPYDTQTVREISPEKSTVSCRTLRHRNNLGRKQISGNCSKLFRSRRMMAQNSELHNMSDINVKRTCMQRSRGTGPSVETAGTKQMSSCHVLPKVRLNLDIERKDTLCSAVSALSSCTFKSPIEVSPVEVKRIETMLWKGSIDEIIQLKDCSINAGVMSQNEVENAKEKLDSCVQKMWSKTTNGQKTDVSNGIIGKNSKEGIEFHVGDRWNRSRICTRAGNTLRKCLCENDDALTSRSMQSASQACTVTTAGAKQSRRLQREKWKRLSLSYRMKATSNSRKKLETNGLIQVNNICIRPCYVKLVKLQDISEQTSISSCKSNSQFINHKASATHSFGLSSLSHTVDTKGCEVRNKLKPCRTVAQQMKIRYSSSRGGAKTNGNVNCNSIESFVDHRKTDVCPVSFRVPTKAKNENQCNKVAVHGRNIGVSKTRNKNDAKVAKTSVLHIQEPCDFNSVQIEPRKQLRRTGKGKGRKTKKLLNNLQPDKSNVLSRMKPFSICLERLDQSVLEKYSVTLSSKTTPQKNTGFLQQGVTSASNKAKIYSDVRGKNITRSGKCNHIHCRDRIPCLDGVFENSSSDDCSESRTVDHSEQSGKSPDSKRARQQEKITQEVENKFTDLQHKNTDYSNSSVLEETLLHTPGFESSAENLNLKNAIICSETHSPVRPLRRSLYPALAIKIQRSPKKRNVVAVKKFEAGSELTDISSPKNTNSWKGGSRLSSVETEVTRPKQVVLEQKLTNAQIQAQPRDMCNIFKNRKRKSSTSVRRSQTFQKSPSVPTDVHASSICDTIRITENQQNISAEKHIFPFGTAKGKHFSSQEYCHVDILHNLNITSSESGNDSNILVTSTSSFPLGSETKMDSVTQPYECSQTIDDAYDKRVSVASTSKHTEAGSVEQMPDKWTGSDIRDSVSNKTSRKQSNSPILRNHPENEREIRAGGNDSENISRDSAEVCVSRTETFKSSGSFGIDFLERKKIVKGRQSFDMFHTEDVAGHRTSSPRIIFAEGMLLREHLTESELPKTDSENMQISVTDSYEKIESIKKNNLDSNFNTAGNRSDEKVQQHTEGVFSFCDTEEEDDDDEGIISFYNEIIPCSPAVSQFKESLIKPYVPADNSSRCATHDFKCALLTHTEQNNSDLVAEAPLKVVNQTPAIEQLRIITADSENHRVYTPKFNPPSKDEILASISQFCIPEYQHQEPFVSNFLDTVNKKEVGNKILRICSTSVLNLQPFVASSLNIIDIETWRKKWLQEFNYTSQRSLDGTYDLDIGNMKPALASHREVTITPCKLPPNVTEVRLWLGATQKLTEQSLPENDVVSKVSRKIMMPLSPGQESASDDDMSVSPATPRSLSFEQSHGGSVAAAHSTPQATPTSHGLPSPSCTPIHKSQHKIAKLLLKRSRKGLKLDSPSQENMSTTLPLIREETAADIGSELVSPLDTSGTYKRQGCDNSSDDLRALDPVQSAKNVNLQSTSEVPDDSETVRKALLHRQIRTILTTPRGLKRGNSSCQIEESTPNNTYGFRMSLENLHEVKAVCEHQFLTTFIMELHVQTRGDLRPDPACDPVRAVFYFVVNDVPEDSGLLKQELGIIVVCNLDGSVRMPLLRGTPENCKLTYVEDEVSLVHELVKCVKMWDPDILGGYEVEMLSWGYLFQRSYTLQINLGPLMSRVPTASTRSHHTEKESIASHLTEEIRVTGRIMLNIWRLMRHEISVQSYTFENMMYHILHQRIALHSFKQLTYWWEHRTHLYRWICVEYYLLRVQGIVKLLDQLDLIGRTSELARLFGIQFLEVLSRGSQFRVESMMLRLAKPLNYVPVSPSIQQRAKMRAPESLPLIMEPNSRFYSDPVIVLDFQSLYPSIIIAYNYCFSTCLGRVEHLGQATPFVFGCTHLKVPPAHLVKLENDINMSPCGVAFVKSGIRKGVLPRMLQEILDTRLMVKQSMKAHKSNKTLQRVLHSRQLGLKLIANVTYGYTAANFSGRMPCIEVGDSVVSKARETLERAIRLVETTSRWGAQVVYGDTDSLFVLVPGRNRQQAFKIGAEIAEAVTLDNPKPVKLKLEKVYEPCILQTKKRYVGYMYESPDQDQPVYDAKGIETVRRDGCPAVAKILEKSLRLIFETKDVSLVKNYVCRQFSKLLRGHLNIQDLIFAREYRGMSCYRPGACVPALELTRRWLQTDRRAEPRQSERVPYVIVNGPPGLPLIRLVRSPHELLADPSLRPNATYYITRVIIPPLDRCFSLLGAEVESWYADMPRRYVTNLPTAVSCGLKKSTISQYFSTMNCAVCSQLTTAGICLTCQQQPQKVAVVLANKIRMWERTYTNIKKVCQSCCGRPESIDCISLDCPILFRRCQSARDLQQAPFIQSLQEQYITF